MDTIYSLLKRAKELKEKSQVDSITPEEVGKLHEDTLAYIASLEQSADGLGIKKVYQSKSAMEADTDPVGTNGKVLRYGQLVGIYDDAHADSSENGNIYAYQKPGWLLMGKVSGGPTLSIAQEAGDSTTKVMSQKAVTDLIEKNKGVKAADSITYDSSRTLSKNNNVQEALDEAYDATHIKNECPPIVATYSSTYLPKSDLSGGQPLSGYMVYSYPVKEGDNILIKGKTNLPTGYSAITLSTTTSNVSQSNLKKTLLLGNGEVKDVNIALTVPNGINAIYLCNSSEYTMKVQIREAVPLKETVEEVSKKMDSLLTNAQSVKKEYNNTIFKSGYYENGGGLMQSQAWTCTDDIPLKKGDLIIAKNCFTDNIQYRGIIQIKDASKSFLYSTSNDVSVVCVTDYRAIEDCYVTVMTMIKDGVTPSVVIEPYSVFSEEMKKSVELQKCAKGLPYQEEYGKEIFTLQGKYQERTHGITQIDNVNLKSTGLIFLNAGDKVEVFTYNDDNAKICVFSSDSFFLDAAKAETFFSKKSYTAIQPCYVGITYDRRWFQQPRVKVTRCNKDTLQSLLLNNDKPVKIPVLNDRVQEGSMIKFKGKTFLYYTTYNDVLEIEETNGGEYDAVTNTIIRSVNVLNKDVFGKDRAIFNKCSYFFVYNEAIYVACADWTNSGHCYLCKSTDGINFTLLKEDFLPSEGTWGNFCIIPEKVNGYFWAFVEHSAPVGWIITAYKSENMDDGWVKHGNLNENLAPSGGTYSGPCVYVQDGKFKMFYHYAIQGVAPTYLAYAEADVNDPLNFRPLVQPLLTMTRAWGGEYNNQVADIDVRDIDGKTYVVATYMDNGLHAGCIAKWTSEERLGRLMQLQATTMTPYEIVGVATSDGNAVLSNTEIQFSASDESFVYIAKTLSDGSFHIFLPTKMYNIAVTGKKIKKSDGKVLSNVELNSDVNLGKLTIN